MSTGENRILVGVDGSEPGRLALEWAIAEAARRGWSLHLMCSYSLPSFTAASLDGGYAALDDSAIRSSAQEALDAALAVVGDRVPATGELATGDAAGALIEASADAGLAVVGTRGGGGFTDRLLGTVSTALSAHSHAPVVVVPHRQSADHAEPAWVQGERAPGPVRKIVVGVDGSPSSRSALACAIAEARLWGAELTAVAGVSLMQRSGVMNWLPAAVDYEQVLADVKAGLQIVVDELAAGTGVKVRLHALDGSGAALLAEFSSAVDLVVVGSRGRGGFAGMLLGSTSQAVLHHAHSPVLVVPTGSYEADGDLTPDNLPWQR